MGGRWMRIRTAVGRALTFSAILSLVLASDALASPRLPPPGWQPPRTTSWTGAVPKHAVILVIDGGVPSYLTLGDFPHLATLEAEGTQYTNAWSGLLESETPTGHA